MHEHPDLLAAYAAHVIHSRPDAYVISIESLYKVGRDERSVQCAYTD